MGFTLEAKMKMAKNAFLFGAAIFLFGAVAYRMGIFTDFYMTVLGIGLMIVAIGFRVFMKDDIE